MSKLVAWLAKWSGKVCGFFLFVLKHLFVISKEEVSLSHIPQVLMYKNDDLYTLIYRLKSILFLALFNILLVFLLLLPKVNALDFIIYGVLLYFTYAQYIKIKAGITSIMEKPEDVTENTTNQS